MKATKRLLLSLLGVLMALPILAFDFAWGGVTLTYTVLSEAQKTCAVSGVPTKTITSAIVPAQAGAYTVTKINDSAFADCTKLTSVIVSPTVTTIGASAFSGCTALTKVYLGPNVSSIGTSAFASDTKLTDIYITTPTPPTIQSNTFPAQTAFTTTPTLHTQGTAAQNAYSNATNWKAFTKTALMPAPTSIKTYNNVNTFSEYNTLATPGNTVTEAKLAVPGGTTYLQSIIYNSDQSLDSKLMFWSSSDVSKVTVDRNDNVTVHNVPDVDVTITGVSIYANSPVIKLVISGGPAYTYEGQTLHYAILDESAATCAVAAPATKTLSGVTIPETALLNGKQYTVTRINACAFYQCSDLVDVALPNTLTRMDLRAFFYTNIAEIALPKSLVTMNSGVLEGTPLKSIVLPNTLTTLGGANFRNCKELKSVVLSNSLTSIQNDIFNGCTVLESVVIPPSIKTVGDKAFRKCAALKTLFFGPNVTSFGSLVFEDTSLADLYITAEKAPSLQSNTFADFKAMLHLQGDVAKANYAKDKTDANTENYWKNFTQSDPMTAPTGIQVFNDINTFNPQNNVATSDTPFTKNLYVPGGTTYKPTTKFISDSKLAHSNMFWTSSDYSKVYVDNLGNITVKQVPEADVTITGISIYANSPVIKEVFKAALPFMYEGQTLYYRVTNESAATCAVAAAGDRTLDSVVIPEKATINGKEYTVTSLGECAFLRCSNLATVSIPNTITSLGFRSFFYTNLESVELPTSIKSFANSGAVFEGTPLTSIVIPSSISTLGSCTFRNCKSLKSITLSNSLTTIPSELFSGCTLLERVIVPPSVKTVGEKAFRNCPALSSVYFGPNITSFDDLAFDGTTNLTDIYITTQIPPSIQAGTFASYTAKLHLQGDAAITNYTKAKTDTGSENYWAKFGTPVLMPAPSGIKTFNDVNTFSEYNTIALPGQTITEERLCVPGGTVYNQAIRFQSDKSLDLTRMFWTSSDYSKVTIDTSNNVTVHEVPETDVTLTGVSIYDNSPVIKLVVGGGLAYTHEGQTLYYKIVDESNRTCAVAAPASRSLTSVIVPEKAILNGKPYTVTSIDRCAFYRCLDLADVSLPNTIASLALRAFFYTKISSISLPTSLKTIYSGALEGTPLTSIVIPNSVTSMSQANFRNCKELKSVTLSNSMTTLPNETFSRCSSLESVVVPPSIKTIGEKAFANCSALKSVYFGPNVVSFGENAFMEDSNLSDIYITTQNAPAVQANTFPAYTATLHLQGDPAKSNYAKDNTETGGINYWKNFTNTVNMNAPSGIKFFNDVNTFSPQNNIASSGETFSTTLCVAGGTSYMQNTLFQSEKTLDLRSMFWTSTNYSDVYVDNLGKVTVNKVPEEDVTITGISIYDNTPVIQTIITGGLPYTYAGETLYYQILSKENSTCAVAAPASNTLKQVEIPEYAVLDGNEYTVISIGKCAFLRCQDLEKVKLPNTITSLGFRSFFYTGLKSITLPSSIKTFASSGAVFEGTPLTAISIPNSVTTIGACTFRNCKELKSVTLSSSLTSIPEQLFRGCTSLQNVVTPPSIKAVESQAFSKCPVLTKVYFGSKITSFGESVFEESPGLTDIYITAQKAPAVQENTFAGYTATLHLQGESAKTEYGKAEYWKNFTKTAVRKPHTGITLSVPTVSGAPARIIRKADAMDAPDHIYAQTGQTHQRTATLSWDNGEAEAHKVQNVFWKSSDASKVYVENDGTVTVNEAPEVKKSVTLTAQSLYANAPEATVTVENQLMTELEEIAFDDEGLDMTRGHIFTFDGIYVGESINGLAPGVYILRQGDKAYKIYIK